MKKYKMLVSDFDGTLSASSENIISKPNLDAINDFIKRGGVFVVCTGRCTSGILPELTKQGYEGLFASYNGAVIGDAKTGKIIFRKAIPNDVCVRFLKFCEENGINVQTYPNDVLTINNYNEFTEWYLTYNKIKYNVVDCLSDYFIKTGCDSAKFVVNGNKELLEKWLPLATEALPECNVVRANNRLIEITLKGVSKGSAVGVLSEIFNVKVEDTIAIGDAGNDISMIKSAGLGIAMGNAPDFVKCEADFIALDVNEDAIKDVIMKFC
ncbi:MAG: HAD family phosphatase [Clostridia bacterium]|nr:HAD family phosphatase [Clostridia bacterium]